MDQGGSKLLLAQDPYDLITRVIGLLLDTLKVTGLELNAVSSGGIAGSAVQLTRHHSAIQRAQAAEDAFAVFQNQNPNAGALLDRVSMFRQLFERY